MLILYHPNSYLNERNYIYNIVFKEFFGITSFKLCADDRHDICIMVDGSKKKLLISDDFFKEAENNWLTPLSLPKQPLPIWNVEEKEIANLFVAHNLPIISGGVLESNSYVMQTDDHILKLGIDIFGSAFFMLTRYEEYIKKDRDINNRFPAIASLAYQEGFLERPIINEYLELLWWGLKKLFPELQKKKREFRIIPTHDVDSPFNVALLSNYKLMRILGGDLIRKKSISTFINRLISIYRTKFVNVLLDPHNTFDKIMNISEQNNLTSHFYFMTSHLNPLFDGEYNIQHPEVKNIIKKVSVRGHEIGLHPCYESYLNGEEIKKEFDKLVEITNSLNINQIHFGSRQHLLRWQCPNTWQSYEDAGLCYDTSVGYADKIGFRCGICFEFPVYNLATRKVLQLKERPLIVMECTALDSKYMGLTHQEAFEKIIYLKKSCKKYCGDFIILWHNNRFIDDKEVNLYKQIIQNAY